MALPAPSTVQVLDDLNAIRLQNDWSIRELAVAMAAEGFRLSPRTLYGLIREKDYHEPYDRTLYKVQKYVERFQERERRREHQKLIAAAAKAAATRAAKKAQRSA